MKRAGTNLVTLVTTCLLIPIAATAAPTLRPLTGGDAALWSAGVSWSGGALPDGDDPVSLRGDTTATGSTFDLANGFAITGLSAGSRSADSGDGSALHTINLNGRTLNVTGNLIVGETGGTGDWTGSVTLRNGTVVLSSGQLDVGIKTGTGSGADALGSVAAGAGLVFQSTALTRLRVGQMSHQSGSANGTVDFANVESGTLAVGGGVDTVMVGSRTAGSTGNGPVGTVTLGANWVSTVLGSEGTRADMRVGTRVGNGPATGNFVQRGGSFTAHLNLLHVGVAPSTDSPACMGTLNVTGVTNLLIDTTVFSVGVGSGATGTVSLPHGVATAGTVTIGGGTAGALNMTNTVLVIANSLTLGTTGRLRAEIGPTSAGIALRNTNAAALGIGSTVTSNDRGLQLTFAEAPVETTKGTAANHTSILYGLKWEGADRTAELTAFRTTNKLAWNDDALDAALGADAVSVFYDTASNATYVGVYLKKPQGTVVLLR